MDWGRSDTDMTSTKAKCPTRLRSGFVSTSVIRRVAGPGRWATSMEAVPRTFPKRSRTPRTRRLPSSGAAVADRATSDGSCVGIPTVNGMPSRLNVASEASTGSSNTAVIASGVDRSTISSRGGDRSGAWIELLLPGVAPVGSTDGPQFTRFPAGPAGSRRSSDVPGSPQSALKVTRSISTPSRYSAASSPSLFSVGHGVTWTASTPGQARPNAARSRTSTR